MSPFLASPRPPPTDRKILEKTETDLAEIFGEKISEKWDLQLCECARKSAAITGSSKGMRPAYPPFMALPIAFDAVSGRGWLCRYGSSP